ncbi:Gar1/Naf1 RNA binding region-domain-containing protein [Irpex rosettiformis]|uniref:Gar1/Naf1 RNA binding region-domain-containing protein n=1 Tax=Irpex rosettiformis TaxID=378272 RepID=A0ACB8UJJ3_9APHY|nr:Gar1/Naf1 RNA binding region-domain-containing protein [Irpex rosettiformis]
MDFKIPSIIPQDLQIIQDLVGELPQPLKAEVVVKPKVEDEDILSSDNEDGQSEKEVEADILGALDDDDDIVGSPSSSDDSSDDSSSESDSEPNIKGKTSIRPSQEEVTGDDDEDGGTGANITAEQMRTKNEVGDDTVVIPEIEEVGEDEVLDRVGEIMSIIDKVAIVKGIPSQVQNRGSDKALDSDTLLVFEDRKVFGYVWETFGPTSQPFYRVQFNEAYPLDPEKVRVSRPVFHVPARSNFVFVGMLKQLKGSDASNAHDEEPGEEELEFSDDEAEREHKRALADKRAGREPSSRHTTSGPSRSQDPYTDDLYGANPYEAAYNDMDFGAGPSRPPPMPYDDDPYSDSYGLPEGSTSTTALQTTVAQPVSPTLPTSSMHNPYEQPRGRGRAGRDRGRGRGQDRRRGDRGRGRGRGRGTSGSGQYGHGRHPSSASDDRNSQTERSISPTSMAIARVTGQFGDGSSHQGQHYQQPVDSTWGYQYPNQYPSDYGYQQSYVQPHINPRFASMFGINMYPQQMQNAYDQTSAYGSGQWSNQWQTNTRRDETSHDQY